MGPRLTGLLGGLATTCALSLAACGGDERTVETVTDESSSSRTDRAINCLEDEGYAADTGHVTAPERRDGATASLSVLLDLEAGSAVDNVVDVYYWASGQDAAAYVKDVGDGPLGDLHHKQLGTVTITYTHPHSHGHEETDQEVEAIADCVA